MTRHVLRQHANIVPRQGAVAATGVSAWIIGLACGLSVILIACVYIITKIVRKRNAHNKDMAQLERGVALPAPIQQGMREVARPTSAITCNKSGLPEWKQLGWRDSLHATQLPPHTCGKRKRDTISLPKRIKHKSGLVMKPWTRKHLSTIAESPRNTTVQRESSLPIFEEMQKSLPRTTRSPDAACTKGSAVPCTLPTRPESPQPNALPSFAIRAGIANNSAAKPKLTLNIRSISMGVLTSDGEVFSGAVGQPPNISKRRRPEMHARSVSLGAPSTRPPLGPVPPLPVTSPANTVSGDEYLRKDICISRMSSSSGDSASSSVLVASPILERRGTDEALQSPTIEDLVEANQNAELKAVANRQWQNPRLSGPRPTANMRVHKSRPSIRGKIVRSSTESALTHRRADSSSSFSSIGSGKNRLSVPQICSAEKVSFSRVSSSNSLVGPGSVTKIATPTKRIKRVTSVSSVSAYGSPAERRRAGALQEVSGNAAPSKGNTPTRQPSASTLVSCSSSNGNPFHWDTASTCDTRPSKPSALKGSPNARKGHRRQNCVRISTLTPQVLGPAATRRRSRSVSPAGLLQGVIEERESDEIQRPRTEPVITPTEERQSFLLACGGRAPKANALDVNNLRVQTLRASLTPSSPTLSTWTSFQQDIPQRPLPPTRQASNDSVNTINTERSASRMSGGSFHIPRFPSPAGKSRASLSPIQCDIASMPHFVGISPVDTLSPLDNISPTDFRHSRNSFALHTSSDEAVPAEESELPSSPPLPISETELYDPASPQVIALLPLSQRLSGGEDYDPASPPSTIVQEPETECRSSLFLPFAMSNLDLMGDEISPRSRPTSLIPAQPKSDSPPCSPKTMSRSFGTAQLSIPEKNPKRATVKLTSESASAMMAAQSINFPGNNVPVLLPPKQDDDDDFCPLPRWESEVSYEDITLDGEEEEAYDPTPRATLARPPSLSTIIQESSSPPAVPRALNISYSAKTPRERTASPLGPRAPPAKSLLRNVTELRRMNSEAQVHRSRESRTYMRLGREASPLLPWIPTSAEGAKREESEESLFDFDFDATSAGAEHQAGNAMDELDFAALEKTIDGALAGFDADYRYSLHSSSPPRRGSDKENQQRPILHERDSSVWDDGEKFWSEQESRPETSESQQTPHYIVSSPDRDSPKRSSYYEEKTMDPRMLSTPMRKEEHRISIIPATPKSLYDADGFLRT
ncbi:hypothetical protein Slin14017_G052980 [Septoria linicola]|nr:hypothetical protein Slin14017_G052980 [Septoria linicola]